MSRSRTLPVEWILGGLLLAAISGYTPFSRGSPADALAVLFLIVGFANPELRHRIATSWLPLAFFTILILLWVAFTISPVPGEAALAGAKILAWLCVGATVWRVAESGPVRRRLARFTVVVVGAMAAIGACLGLAGGCVGELPGTQLYPNFPLGFAAVRFVGFFPTANDVALVFLIALLLVPLAAFPRRRDRLLITILILTGLVATWSRLLVPALLALAIMHRFRGRLLALVGLGCTQMAATWVTHVHMGRSPTVESLWVASTTPFAKVGDLYLSRMGYLDLKLAAFDMWLDHPFFGVGLRGFGPSLAQYVEPTILPKLLEVGTTPHSTYGMILAELGLAGVLVIGVCAWRLWRHVWRELSWRLARQSSPSDRDSRRILIAATVSLLLIAVDLELQHHRLLYIAIGLLGGFLGGPFGGRFGASIAVDPAPSSKG